MAGGLTCTIKLLFLSGGSVCQAHETEFVQAMYTRGAHFYCTFVHTKPLAEKSHYGLV